MNILSTLCKTCKVIPILSLVSGLCWAQENPDKAAAKMLSEVVVTATKFETPLKETSRPVQIISQQEIQQSGAQDLAQVLQRQVGIIVNGAYGNPGTVKSLYMRGATYEFTSILVDGIPIGDPSGIGGVLDFRLLQLGQVERIEIMKGSQSSLYGSGAISGVINIITKKGGKEKIGASGLLSTGSLNTSNASLDVGGSTGKFNYNAGVHHFFTEGISDAKPPSTANHLVFDKDRFAQTGVTASIGFNPIEQIAISPYLRFTKNEGAFDKGAFMDTTTYNFHTELLNTGAIIAYKAKKIKARLSYGYMQTDRFFVYNTDSKYKGRLHDLDGYVAYKFNDIFSLSGGLNYQGQEIADAAGDISNPSASIMSSYWNTIVTPLSGLIVELSYRLNIHSRYGVNSTYAIAPAYWITKNLKVFASYNTGYKAPTLGQLYGRFGSNESLQPQTSTSWEIGGQYYLIKSKLEGTITYYNRAIDDLIVYASDGYINRDLQQNSGVETSINWSASKALNIKLVYDFMTGSITERNSQSDDTTYNNLIRRPAHSLNLTVAYKPTAKLSMSLNGQYIGKRKDVFYEVFARKIIDLEPYFLLNAYLAYEIVKEKMIFFADLKNITDNDFSEVYGYGNLRFNAQFGFRFKL